MMLLAYLLMLLALLVSFVPCLVWGAFYFRYPSERRWQNFASAMRVHAAVVAIIVVVLVWGTPWPR